jgi:lipopolysaccharide/colanic/teichoic acid biosynthesis glycosyltransferase
MVSNAEQLLTTDPQMRSLFDQKFKIDDDPRVTPFGKFLRCTSLDELPQLFHVIQGKMSLIGPRPIIEREREKYAIYVGKLLSVRPGLSGLWQVAGRSDTTYADRVLLDMYYIDNRGFVLDLKIFLKTFSAVIKRAGAR